MDETARRPTTARRKKLTSTASRQEEESESRTTEVPNGQEFRVMYTNGSGRSKEYWVLNMLVSGVWGVGLYKFDEFGQVSSSCFVNPAEELRDGLQVDPQVCVASGDNMTLCVTHPSSANCTFKKIKV